MIKIPFKHLKNNKQSTIVLCGLNKNKKEQLLKLLFLTY